MAALKRWLLPDGIEEVLPEQAAQIEAARRQVLDLFASWGYEYIVTPHIEFLDSLLTGVGRELALRTFSVTDPLSGQLMGFRADITPQVARLDAHSLLREGPSRLCYAGSVVHTRPREFTHSRSPIQIGTELYGDASPSADVEIISLMLETLRQTGVEQPHLDLGHVGIYRSLARAAGLSAEQEALLFNALQRKARSEIGELTAELDPALSSMLQALAGLCGDFTQVIEQANELLAAGPAGVAVALSELQEIAAVIRQRYPDLVIYLDLSELRGYNYHTGVVFAAFVPAAAEAVAQGGRYDDTGAVFGRARPATGFSTDLKTLVSLGANIVVEKRGAIWAPADGQACLWQQVQQLRNIGERVIQALPGQTLENAREAGCDRQLQQVSGSWLVNPISL